MTNANYTHLLTIVDRSGSMAGCAVEMTNAINEFYKGQAEVEGKCLVDYVQFDNRYEKAYEDTPVANAEAFIHPRGSTALLDAVGRGVTELGAKLRKMKEADRPGTVMVVVVTDGYENASQEWNAEGIRTLIKDQEDKYNWDFVFLGANMDAQQVGASFGFNADKSLTYDVALAGATMSNLNSYATRSRVSGSASNSFSDEERLTSTRR